MEKEKGHHSHGGHHSGHGHKHHETHAHKEKHHKAHHEAKHHEVKHKAPRKKGKEVSYTPYVLGGLAVIIIIIAIFKMVSGPSAAPSGDTSKYGSVNVTFYVMSQCPYGTQVEDAIEPVLDELGSNVNFRLEFIAGETGSGFQSLHGQPEVDGDILHLCVQELYPDDLMDFVVCQNKNVQDLKGTIEKCAKGTSIDTSKVKECTDGEKGKSLMSESIKRSQAAGASGSPTIYIGGTLYQGARDSTSFKRVICGSLDSHPSCEDMPACSSDLDCRGQAGKVGICNNPGKSDASCTYQDDEQIYLTVVNAKECTSCDSTQLLGVLKQIFLNLDVDDVDASSSTGKNLIKELGLEHAPSFVFKGDIEKTYAWKNNERLRGAFQKSGNYYVLLDEASGATYILDAKKRAELEKLTGVTKGDNKPQIDFYVMSYCPYGNIAEEAIEPVYQLLGDKADFNPHYVIYSNYQGGGPNYCLDDDDLYCSMHGVQELNQGLRELCVNKYMGIKEYFEFTLAMNDKCSYQNADTCWEDVADDLGLDTAKIKSCEKNEWETILSNELKLNKALGVRGSPTIFVEGAAYSGSRTPRGYGDALCAGFDTKPTECSKLGTLSGDTSSPAASAGGCG